MSLSRKARRARQRGNATTAQMSEVLTDIAMPLLEQVPDGDDEGYELALKLGAMLWNASRETDEQAREKAIIDLVKLGDGLDSAEIEELCRHVVARAKHLYPRLDRVIARVQVDPLPGGRYNVSVMSAG